MTGPCRVIVVDDNHLIRRLLELLLSGAGYVPLLAESVADALALAAPDPPNAWIVDHEMPVRKGAELVRTLRASPDPRLAKAPVIGVSGFPASEAALVEAGVDAFVKKPVDEAALLEALSRVLGRAR